MKIWDTNTGTELQTLKDEKSYYTSAQFSPNGKYFATALDNGILEIWSVE